MTLTGKGQTSGAAPVGRERKSAACNSCFDTVKDYSSKRLRRRGPRSLLALSKRASKLQGGTLAGEISGESEIDSPVEFANNA